VNVASLITDMLSTLADTEISANFPNRSEGHLPGFPLSEPLGRGYPLT